MRITQVTDRVSRVRDILVSRGVDREEAHEIASMKLLSGKPITEYAMYILPAKGIPRKVDGYFCEFAGYTKEHVVRLFWRKDGYKMFVGRLDKQS